jgi:hypothetical protein
MGIIANFKSYVRKIENSLKKYINYNKSQRNFFVKHKIITGVLVIILILSINSSLGKNRISVSSTNSAINILAPIVNKNTSISFSNIRVTSSSKTTTVNGKIKSTNGIKHSFIIQVSFYSKSKKLLGIATGSISKLQPKSKEIFTVIGTGDYSKSASYEVDVKL